MIDQETGRLVQSTGDKERRLVSSSQGRLVEYGVRDGVITNLANSLRNIEIPLFLFVSITFHYFLALMSHHYLSLEQGQV